MKTPKEWAEQAFPNAPSAQRICEQVIRAAVKKSREDIIEWVRGVIETGDDE